MAQEACQRINGTLAITSNDDVTSFVHSLVSSKIAWIGAFRPPQGTNIKDGWEWKDGTPWGFEDWAPDEPDVTVGTGFWTFSEQACASHQNEDGGRHGMHATPCSNAYQYVCQKKCKGICYYYLAKNNFIHIKCLSE